MSETELCALCQKPIKTARASICLDCATRKVVSLEWLKKYCETHETLRDCVDRNEIIKAAENAARRTKDAEIEKQSKKAGGRVMGNE